MESDFGKRWILNPVTGCWIWKTNRKQHWRYGSCDNEPAHRASWKYHYGAIPEGLFIGHKCNNKRCVNPEHLYLCTNRENTQHASRDGLLRGQKRPLTLERVDQIWDMRLSGWTQWEIAAAYEVGQITVSRIWRGRGYVRGRSWHGMYEWTRPAGENHPHSKITDKQRDQIWDLRLSGMTQREIGTAYGVTEGAVSHLWKRRGYRMRAFVARKGR